MKPILSKARVEHMVNHLDAHNVEATWWYESNVPTSDFNSIYLKIIKKDQLKLNYFDWVLTWFPKTIKVSDTDTYIEFILGV